MQDSMSTRETIQSLRAEDPEMSATVIAEQLGVSRERVRQLLNELGLPTKTAAPPRIKRKPIGEFRSIRHQRFKKPVNRCSTGAHAEMIVCADLLGRGLDVFRSISSSARCDLIASSRTRNALIRIDVKSGFRRQNGHVSYPMPIEPNSCDLIAVVLLGGELVYVPDDKPLDALDTA